MIHIYVLVNHRGTIVGTYTRNAFDQMTDQMTDLVMVKFNRRAYGIVPYATIRHRYDGTYRVYRYKLQTVPRYTLWQRIGKWLRSII